MKQESQLLLDRCPHCNVAKPNLNMVWNHAYSSFAQTNNQKWATYYCSSCGNIILTSASPNNLEISQIWPKPHLVDENVPQRARDYLSQAIASLHAPAGAVMLTASAVDAMLKDKGFKDGNLYSRIDSAKTAILLLKKWLYGLMRFA